MKYQILSIGLFLAVQSHAQGPITNEALAQIRQAPTAIQSKVLRVVEESCTGAGGPGESRTLVKVSAKDRASQMQIPVEQAIQVNAFLLQIKAPCSATLLSPAVLREDNGREVPATTAI